MASAARSQPSPVVRLTVTDFADISALAADLEALCEAGILEAFRDESNVVRYRPVAKA